MLSVSVCGKECFSPLPSFDDWRIDLDEHQSIATVYIRNRINQSIATDWKTFGHISLHQLHPCYVCICSSRSIRQLSQRSNEPLQYLLMVCVERGKELVMRRR